MRNLRGLAGWIAILWLAPACAMSLDRNTLFEAGKVAFDDDAAQLEREEAAARGGDEKLARYVFDLTHYAVGMAYSARGIEVEIQLRSPTDPDFSIQGGGGHYLIDRTTLRIIDKRLYE